MLKVKSGRSRSTKVGSCRRLQLDLPQIRGQNQIISVILSFCAACRRWRYY